MTDTGGPAALPPRRTAAMRGRERERRRRAGTPPKAGAVDFAPARPIMLRESAGDAAARVQPMTAIAARLFRALPALFALGPALFLLAAPDAAQAQRPAPVRVDAVVVEPLVETAPVLGRLVSRTRGDVAAQTVGAVTEIRVRTGDRVARGDVLAVLDIERLTSERDARAATAAAVAARAVAAEARLERAEQELARYEKLRRSAAFSKANLEDKAQERAWLRSDFDAARAQLVQARASLALAELSLARGMVRAPYDGVVTARHTEVGSYIKEGGAIVGMVNDRDLEIEADVPAGRITGLSKGVQVAVTLPDGTEHTASVRAVVPEENAMTRTRIVRFTPTFGATKTPLAANAAATVILPVGASAPALTVHKDAIVRRGQQAIVYVAQENKAEMRPVRLGRAAGPRFEVLEGLAEGDLAIVRGNERLRPGQAVVLPGAEPGNPDSGAKTG